MPPIAIAEIVSAIFVFLSFISQFSERDHSESMERLKTLYTFTLVSLLADAVAYIFVSPDTNAPIVIDFLHFLNMLAYVMSNVGLMTFSYYCDAYIREKTTLNKWVFRVPILFMAVNVVIDVTYYFAGKLVIYKNGTFVDVGTAPIYVMISYLVLLFYAPVVAYTKRKEIGMKAVVLLASYGVPIIISIVIIALTKHDLSVVAASISIIFVITLLQKELTRSRIEADAAHQALVENNMRMLALEDNFETLYDVELETGNYDVFVKGEKDDKEHREKASILQDYFSDLRKKIDAVVYPEDCEGLYDVLNKDALCEKLNKDAHFDYYYRIIAKDSTIWHKLRAVYKDTNKKNAIIGVFNADAEMAVKNRERQRRKELIEKMTDYDGVFLIDCVNDTRKTVHDRLLGAPNYRDEDKYTTSINKYVKNFVAEVDRAMMAKMASPEYMLERLKDDKEYTVHYRDTTTGAQRFYEMRITKFTDTEILQCFKENDKKIIEEMIFNKLEENYFAMFVVNLDVGLFRVVKNSPWYPVGKIGAIAPYASAMRTFAAEFKGEPKDFFERISNIDYLKKRFAKEDKASFIYMSHIVEGIKWVNVTELVLSRHDDGTPSLLALGFSLLDEDASKKEDMRVTLLTKLNALSTDKVVLD